MPTGDPQDVAGRLRQVLPPWFGDTSSSPLVGGVLAGLGTGHAAAYGLLQQVIQQTRIRTATGGFLDMIAWDFFAGRLVRRPNESDASFAPRLLAEIIRPRATRASVVRVLTDLTGRPPSIFEPTRPLDTGAYGVAAVTGYGVAGGYGSLLLPAQAFITAYRPATTGIPLINGYGGVTGGYGTRFPRSPGGGYGTAGGQLGGYGVGALPYAPRPLWAVYAGSGQSQVSDLTMVQSAVTDADIYAAIDSVKPAGATLWTRLSN
jgi:hypothetical protein